MDVMRKMLILSNERYKAVKIALESGVMELVSTNPDLGEAQENIEIQYNGERLEAGFNPRYFIDILQAMESETVKLGFVDTSKPCVTLVLIAISTTVHALQIQKQQHLEEC